jgi:hypothetical protein
MANTIARQFGLLEDVSLHDRQAATIWSPVSATILSTEQVTESAKRIDGSMRFIREFGRGLVVAGGVIFLLGSNEAVAQEPVKVKSGEEARLAALGSIRPDCAPNPAPEVRLSKAASHGMIRIASGRITTDRFPNCPGATVPVKVVFYQSSSDFRGHDRVVLNVDQDGQVTNTAIDIEVE